MESSKSSNNKKILIFLPISVPGSGKSFLMNIVKNQLKETMDNDLHVISSDVLRKKMMDELSEKEPNLSRDELFAKTSKRAPHQFTEEIVKLLKKISENSHKDLNFLFIDKNNLPNQLPKVLDLLHNKCNGLFDQWRFVGLIPESFQSHQLFPKLIYPFSINFMMNCLQRVQSRKDTHETLNGQGYKSANILFSFINAYRNFRFDISQIKSEFGFHAVIRMPMTLESKESNSQFDSSLIDLFNEIIKDDNYRFDTEKNKDKVQKFLEVFESKQFVFQQVSLEAIKSFINFLLEECFNLFNKQKKTKEIEKQNNIEEEKKEESNFIQSNLPAKIPLFLSIMIEDQISAQKRISEHILSNLNKFLNENPDDKFIPNEINYLSKSYKFPKTLHVTTLFLGSDKNKARSDNFKLFQEGKKIKIEIEAIVFVPGKIVCGICFFDGSEIKIENQYPHLTLMVDQWAPKHSNDVLNSVFNNNKSPLYGCHSKEYFRNLKTIKFVIPGLQINLGKKIEKSHVYILKLDEMLSFDASTQYVF